MKNIVKLVVIGLLMCAISACKPDNTKTDVSALTKNINNDHIYFFYQTSCPHCHHAVDYISQKYPNLKMISLDVRTQANFNLFLKCANKFKLDQSALGTPLICMGNHYIMGWSDADKVKFDLYVQQFK